MKPSGRPRSTRDRPAKAPLSEEAIIDAALAILKAEGLEALSMRRVAAALDTGAGSLYVYVDGRDGLLEAMFDRIIAAVKLETPDPSRWRAQLHNLLGRLRAALITHPGMAAATMVDPPQTEVALRLLENLLGILLAGGLGAQDAAWAAAIPPAPGADSPPQASGGQNPAQLRPPAGRRLSADYRPRRSTGRRRCRRTVPLRH